MPTAKLVLLDGQNLAYRLIHRSKPPRLHHGADLAGVWEFMLEWTSLLNRLTPTHFAVAWDTPRNSYVRRQLFHGYKANRPEGVDESVRYQLRWIRDLVKVSGVPCLEASGWEADDVVATCLHRFVPLYQDAIILARDKDYHQLVGPKVRVYDGEVWVDEDDVRDRWGVDPEQVVEVQTLAGDPTDGVPGLPGIGLKRAAELVNSYGSAEAALAAGKNQSAKMRARFEEFDYEVGRSLVELNVDAPVEDKGRLALGTVTVFEQLAFKGLDLKAMEPAFAELGFEPWWLEKVAP